MSELRIITVKILVPVEDADDVTYGHINLATHDESWGAYATDAPLTDEDRETWGPTIQDREEL